MLEVMVQTYSDVPQTDRCDPRNCPNRLVQEIAPSKNEKELSSSSRHAH